MIRAALLFLALAACASAPREPVVLTQEVSKPVATPCAPPNTPEPPEITSDDILRALEGPERYGRTAADRLKLKSYMEATAPILRECRQ